MMTNSQVKDVIVANLGDDRIFSIQAFLTRLIERKVHGDGIAQYRIKDTKTDTFVSSLDDFIAKLDANSLHPDYFYYSDKMEGDRTHPMAVNLANFEVQLNEHSDEDNIYTQMFGKSPVKNILLLINYLSDADSVLPLKIFEIKLLAQK